MDGASPQLVTTARGPVPVAAAAASAVPAPPCAVAPGAQLHTFESWRTQLVGNVTSAVRRTTAALSSSLGRPVGCITCQLQHQHSGGGVKRTRGNDDATIAVTANSGMDAGHEGDARGQPGSSCTGRAVHEPRQPGSPSFLASMLVRHGLFGLGAPSGTRQHLPASASAAGAAAGAARAVVGGPPDLGTPEEQAADTAVLEAAASASGGSSATHLIVLANGLFGSPSNWSTICDQLRKHLDMTNVILHPSQVNRYTDTYDGIDVCGQRLADEIRSVAAQHPRLQRISVIGHSMGGLLVRHAIGLMYNPQRGTIAGLEPCHLITMATPHLGCDGQGLAQVPWIGWMPPSVQRLLQSLSVPVSSLIFRNTGRQFFLADGNMGAAAADAIADSAAPGSAAAVAAATAGGPAPAPAPNAVTLPLLYRMTHDEPERGLYWHSALLSFKSRTAYANTDGDHLVGWANSSLRFLHELPHLPPAAQRAKGVVREDPLGAAFGGPQSTALPHAASSSRDVPVREPDPLSPLALGLNIAKELPLPGAASTSAGNGGSAAGSADDDDGSEPAPAVVATAEAMLLRLQAMPWRRIDVSFKGALWGLAHNNIQVTRKWMNFEGMAVAKHLAQQVVELEEHVRQGAAATQGAGVGTSTGPALPLQQQAPGPALEPAGPSSGNDNGGGFHSLDAGDACGLQQQEAKDDGVDADAGALAAECAGGQTASLQLQQ